MRPAPLIRAGPGQAVPGYVSKTDMVAALRNVTDELAQRVAVGLGLAELPEALPAARPPVADLDPQVVMQPRRVMQLDHEPGLRHGRDVTASPPGWRHLLPISKQAPTTKL